MGNRQDFSLSSSLNLILSGKLNNDLEIQAAISDNNIPIQPDGNTQQIQEFDKIFIRLSKEKIFSLPAISKCSHYRKVIFLNTTEKLRSRFSDFVFAKYHKNDEMFIRANGSFGKGRYTRQEIKAIESNLGPYKLKGNNNETFIIVLAGSEKFILMATCS